MAQLLGIRWTMLDHTGGAVSSATTSQAFLVAGLRQMSMSVQTVTAFVSRVTVQGCNADGSTVAIPDGAWSNLTTLLLGNQIVVVDPGIRWLRVASASSCTVVLSGA